MSSELKSIFLVDDDKDLRETLTDGLEAAGYEVHQAGRLDNTVMRQLASVRPAIIIVDLMLVGGSGAALVGYAKAHPRLKHTKVILISGHEHAKHAAEQWGADSFLHKPITIAILLETLRNFGA